MIQKISDQIYKWTKGWSILLSIFVFILLTNLQIFDPTLVSRSLDGKVFY